MRLSLNVAIGLCALTGVVSAANADPYYHRYSDPYYHRYSDGSWTNAEYNDGSCHFDYSHNAYDNETHVNRYGDCSQIAIGPNGEAVPLMAAPVAIAPY
jgi:hypothetical protein